MMVSMLVLLVPIIAIVWFFQTTPEESVDRVDYQPLLERAEAEAAYPILRPVNAPENWVPVRVAWAGDGESWIDGTQAVGDSWQLGHMTEGEIYIGLQQRNASVESFLRSVTREGSRQDEVLVGERTWEHWVSEDARTNSLVWREGDMVAAVTGDTDLERLVAFAGTLHTDG